MSPSTPPTQAEKIEPATATTPVTGPTRVKWLIGAQCVRFSVSMQFGRGGIHQVSVDATSSEICEAAKSLRDAPDAQTLEYRCSIRRGNGVQVVPLQVQREMMIGIADAMEGAADADDAGHRFHHWEHPYVTKPCSGCREVRLADDARVDAARVEFVSGWADRLGTSPEEVELLLSEFFLLPTRTPW